MLKGAGGDAGVVAFILRRVARHHVVLGVGVFGDEDGGVGEAEVVIGQDLLREPAFRGLGRLLGLYLNVLYIGAGVVSAGGGAELCALIGIHPGLSDGLTALAFVRDGHSASSNQPRMKLKIRVR